MKVLGKKYILFICLFVSVLFIQVAILLFRQPWYLMLISASQSTPEKCRLICQTATGRVESIVEGLQLLSVQPELRNFSGRDGAERLLNDINKTLVDIGPELKILAAMAYTRWNWEYSSAIYLFENMLAYGRKVLYDTVFEPLVFVIPQLAEHSSYKQSSLDSIRQKGTFVDNLSSWAYNLQINTANHLRPLLQFIDSIFFCNKSMLADKLKVKRILTDSLHSQKHIRALAIKNTNGVVLTEISGFRNTQLQTFEHDIVAIIEGANFFDGQVSARISGLNYPLWHVAVPLKDSSSVVRGALSALIDLQFLSEIAQIHHEQSDEKVLFVDSTGIIIGSHNDSLLMQSANQDVLVQNESNKSIKLIQSNSSYKIVSSMIFSSDSKVNFPQWQTVLYGNMRDYPYPKTNRMAVFLLAVTGIYVLFYSLRIITGNYN